MLPDSILPVPEDDIARILRDYERRLSHLETLEGGGGGFEIGARVFNDATQSIPRATPTVLTFNQERYDTDGIHSVLVNTSRLTSQTAGKYAIDSTARWSGNPTNSVARILLNGATGIAMEQIVGHVISFEVSTIYELVVGDYVELQLEQFSPGALVIQVVGNESPEFMMQKIG